MAGLTAVAGKTKARIEAVRLLNKALAQETPSIPRGQLRQGLGGGGGAAGTRRGREGANQAFAQEKDVNARWQLAGGLAEVAGRLEPAEAADC